MTPKSDCIRAEATIAELAAHLTRTASMAPVISGAHCLGTIGAAAVARTIASGHDPATHTVEEAMPRRPAHQASIGPDANLDAAKLRMIENGVEHLAVCDGELVGVVTWATLESQRREAPDGLPLPGPGLIELVLGDVPVRARSRVFYEGGARMADIITTVAAAHDHPIEVDDTVLDFGCGCGRVIRHLRSITPHLHGCDYNAQLVHWCATNLPFAEFRVNRLEAPTEYANESFDLIYALSVFTHLPQALQRPWIAELSRIARPGAAILLTLHGESRVHALTSPERAIYESGEIVVRHDTEAGSNVCSTYHPERYVKETLAADLELLAYLPRGALDMNQDIVLLAKP